ncbi:MAG: hypothetical protein QNJ55_09655 [Xenococcus sp. MO_188.B8]|nr:hypothetical protein [Xenococcus sp. MO_188.B8]
MNQLILLYVGLVASLIIAVGLLVLGTEMLRNIESFWCPIRFYSEKKCENCQLDFPDVADSWVAADGTMEDVTKLLESKYTPNQEERAWYGHP